MPNICMCKLINYPFKGQIRAILHQSTWGRFSRPREYVAILQRNTYCPTHIHHIQILSTASTQLSGTPTSQTACLNSDGTQGERQTGELCPKSKKCTIPFNTVLKPEKNYHTITPSALTITALINNQFLSF